MEKQKRSRNVLVQLTPQELEIIDELVKNFSSSRSQIMRMALLQFVQNKLGDKNAIAN